MKIYVPTNCMHFNYKSVPNADTAPQKHAYQFLYSLYNNFALITRTYYTYKHSKNDSQLRTRAFTGPNSTCNSGIYQVRLSIFSTNKFHDSLYIIYTST